MTTHGVNSLQLIQMLQVATFYRKIYYMYMKTILEVYYFSSETEAKFIQARIHSVERNLAEFCSAFAQYSRKLARVRDKGDELARITLNIAENENINKSLAVGLENFADCMSQISDYGDMRVQTIDTKVVGEFTRYEDICKQAKEEVKEIYNTRDKEILKKRQLDRLRERNPRNRQQIIQAETELVKAATEVSKSIHSLEEKTNAFERQKLHDIKSTVLDFIVTEIGYHAKCLEILSKGFADVQSINEEADLEEFKKTLRLPETMQRKSLGKNWLFRSTGSLGSLGMIFSSSHNKRTPGIPNPNKMSKSEETLDSMKQSFTDTEESESEDTVQDVSISSDDYDEDDKKNKKMSPTFVRKFKK